MPASPAATTSGRPSIGVAINTWPAVVVDRRELFDCGDAVRAGADMDAAFRRRLPESAGLLDHLQRGGIVRHHREHRVAEIRHRLDRGPAALAPASVNGLILSGVRL